MCNCPCQLRAPAALLPGLDRRYWISRPRGAGEKRLSDGPAAETWTSMNSSHQRCRQKGSDKDQQQCHRTAKELRQAYHWARAANNRSDAEPQTCHFYSELQAILGRDPTSTWQAIVDTSRDPETQTPAWNSEEQEEGDVAGGPAMPRAKTCSRLHQSPAIPASRGRMRLMKGKRPGPAAVLWELWVSADRCVPGGLHDEWGYLWHPRSCLRGSLEGGWSRGSGLGCGVLLRWYLRTLYLGLQSRWQSEHRQSHFYWRMMFESADISMLRLLETFLKSAPQLVLQLSIMVQQNNIEPLQGLSASASLVSLAWMIASYQKVLRDSREDKMPMSYKGAVVQILWHLFTIAARAIAFALFASVFQLYFGIFIVTHWCIMTFWIIQGETDFCMSKWEEIIYNMVVGIIYIFCWFNVKEGRSRCRMAIYYTITLAENAALTGLWYMYYDRQATADFDALIIVCVVSSSFALGIFFMFIYYCLLHPNGPVFGPQTGGCIFKKAPAACVGPPEDVITSPPRSLPRTTGGEREGVPGDRDSCVPVFQVRPSVPPTPVARAPRTEGPVIRIDLPRKKYPAWDAHFIDRRLRKTILALEYSSPATPRLQYRSMGASQEVLEYETTV
ncbi:XK-related protein 7 [Chelonia mydas]|uniref:XK-related protein n=1 Tax=Chelonia mydas TaxID=8469 RepID=M7B7X7_CHEMY|nr:XK-related protein 7 [Chelonia mydas]